MELIEAIKARHSVRKYLDRPIEKAKVAQLREAVDTVNAESGLNVQLVLNEPKAFSSGLWKYGQFSGVLRDRRKYDWDMEKRAVTILEKAPDSED